jgi:hypothetical protein
MLFRSECPSVPENHVEGPTMHEDDEERFPRITLWQFLIGILKTAVWFEMWPMYRWNDLQGSPKEKQMKGNIPDSQNKPQPLLVDASYQSFTATKWVRPLGSKACEYMTEGGSGGTWPLELAPRPVLQPVRGIRSRIASRLVWLPSTTIRSGRQYRLRALRRKHLAAVSMYCHCPRHPRRDRDGPYDAQWASEVRPLSAAVTRRAV